MLRVIGIGSPYGADRIGWLAIERLRTSEAAARWGARVQFHTADRPGAGLLAQWRGAAQVILIDAMLTGAAPGTVRRFAAQELAQAQALLSSHGFGVRAALALAAALGERPVCLAVYGVEIEPGDGSAGEEALPALLAAVSTEIEEQLEATHA